MNEKEKPVSKQEPTEEQQGRDDFGTAEVVDERLAERLEATRRRRAWLEAERRRRKKKRDAGLRARHAAKLRRTRKTE